MNKFGLFRSVYDEKKTLISVIVCESCVSMPVVQCLCECSMFLSPLAVSNVEEFLVIVFVELSQSSTVRY